MPRHSPDAFAGAGRRYAAYERSLFVVIPVGYERTVTYVRGTRKGPAAILEASRNMETYDEVVGEETVEHGIHCLAPIYPSIGPARAAGRLEGIVTRILRDGKIPVVLGGEHSLSLGSIRACRKILGDLGVLHLDAHADLRESYEGTRYGHGCVMRRVVELCPITQVGVRSLSGEEARLIDGGVVTTFFAHRRRKGRWPPRGMLGRLPRRIYISIDMDVFDPALVPGVGTPEPGGLSWDEVAAVVREAAGRREVVAFDVMETRPIPGSVISEFTAAKIAYRIMGHIAASAGGRKSIARGPRRR